MQTQVKQNTIDNRPTNKVTIHFPNEQRHNVNEQLRMLMDLHNALDNAKLPTYTPLIKPHFLKRWLRNDFGFDYIASPI